MVKKNTVVVASAVVAGTIVAAYVLLGNMNMGVERSENGQGPAAIIPENSTIVKIVANAGSNSFNPSSVKAKVGESVTWINYDSGRHTVTANDGSFDSGMMGKGQSFSHIFDKVGEYQYSCSPHPAMVGTVVVTE